MDYLVDMNSNKNLLIIVFLIISCSLLGADSNILSTKYNWILDWKEEFNESILDTAVWTYMERRQGGSWKYHSNNPKCYEIKNGILILRGLQNTRLDLDSSEYITGGV